MVLNRSPDCPVTLKGEGQSDIDGAAEDEVVKLVQEVAERVLVGLVELAVVSEKKIQREIRNKYLTFVLIVIFYMIPGSSNFYFIMLNIYAQFFPSSKHVL